MINEPSVLDEAAMKLEFRRLYREIGFSGCMQVMYEFLQSAKWLSDVMLEEKRGKPKQEPPPCNGTCCS